MPSTMPRRTPRNTRKPAPMTDGPRRIAVKSVTIMWAEGECDLSAADDEVTRFCTRHIRDRGPFKVGFAIAWADGEEYEGRLEVEPRSRESIALHVRRFLGFYSGRVVPSHYTRERMDAYLDAIKANRAAGGRLLDSYDLGAF